MFTYKFIAVPQGVTGKKIWKSYVVKLKIFL